MLIETFLRQQVEKAQFGVALIDARTALDIADWIERHRETEPVVRCKDCKHRIPNPHGYTCKKIFKEVSLDDYCAWGERREDGCTD